MRTLLIDDLRDVDFVNHNWVVEVTDVARTFADGINALKAGSIDILLLDHDLACFDDDGNELTGYKVMLFLEEHPEYLPKRIVLVTSNPVGRAKMQVVIDKLFQK
jgi:hypothetical protein